MVELKFPSDSSPKQMQTAANTLAKYSNVPYLALQPSIAEHTKTKKHCLTEAQACLNSNHQEYTHALAYAQSPLISRGSVCCTLAACWDAKPHGQLIWLALQIIIPSCLMYKAS